MHSQRSRSDTEAGQAGECARGTEDRQTDRQTARRNEWHPTDNMPDHASVYTDVDFKRRPRNASFLRAYTSTVCCSLPPQKLAVALFSACLLVCGVCVRAVEVGFKNLGF